MSDGLGKPTRLCRTATCSGAPDHSGYCHGCRGRRVRVRTGNEPGRQWYATPQWRRLRESVLRRARYLCECASCRQALAPQPATVADHIVPHRGNQHLFFSLDNLQALSKVCHDRKTMQETRRGC